jgi:1-acyl-sn-glycerol-3-phosphate acyltransferase
LSRDLMDPETWKGAWYMAGYTLRYQSDMLRRRLAGDYETDEWGLDREFLEAVRPFLDFLYKLYWRVESTGMAHLPDYDGTLLVANRSGLVPWDSLMIMTAVLNEHPAQRLVRNLYDDSLPRVPFIAPTLVKLGQALAAVDNGVRLLRQDELVAVYPEGLSGATKPFSDRYRLAGFGRGEFVRMALLTGTPMIPVAVIGAEESYLSVRRSRLFALLENMAPWSSLQENPWYDPLALLPAPARWSITFGEPIPVTGFGPEAAEDPVVVGRLRDQMRDVIQQMLEQRLAQRKPAFS